MQRVGQHRYECVVSLVGPPAVISASEHDGGTGWPVTGAQVGLREDRREVVLDVNSELRREDGDVHAEGAAQLAERLIERPFVAAVEGFSKTASTSIQFACAAQELATRGSHCPEMRSKVVVLVTLLPELGSEEMTYIENRVDAVSWRFGSHRIKQHPPVL